jgi:hypothetical protein
VLHQPHHHLLPAAALGAGHGVQRGGLLRLKATALF